MDKKTSETCHHNVYRSTCPLCDDSVKRGQVDILLSKMHQHLERLEVHMEQYAKSQSKELYEALVQSRNLLEMAEWTIRKSR